MDWELIMNWVCISLVILMLIFTVLCALVTVVESKLERAIYAIVVVGLTVGVYIETQEPGTTLAAFGFAVIFFPIALMAR